MDKNHSKWILVYYKLQVPELLATAYASSSLNISEYIKKIIKILKMFCLQSVSTNTYPMDEHCWCCDESYTTLVQLCQVISTGLKGQPCTHLTAVWGEEAGLGYHFSFIALPFFRTSWGSYFNLCSLAFVFVGSFLLCCFS